MTEETIYSGAGDGHIARFHDNWNIAHDSSTGTAFYTGTNATLSTRQYESLTHYIERTFFPFDTSGLPDNAVILSAVLWVYFSNILKAEGTCNVALVQTTQASPTELVTEDFDQCGDIDDPTEGAPRTVVNTTGWKTWTLDATGRSWINKEGWTKLGLRTGWLDCDDVASIYEVKNLTTRIYTSEQTGELVPKLVITYSIPTAHEVTITESQGMLDSVTKKRIFKRTITDIQGMTDSVIKQFDAKKVIDDKMGMLDTIPTKAAFKQSITDSLGMTDTVTRQKSMFQTITDIQGMVDTTTTKVALKQVITDVMGILDTITRGFPLKVTITEIQGMRDRLVTKKRKYPLPDLPDHTIRGGAQD